MAAGPPPDLGEETPPEDSHSQGAPTTPLVDPSRPAAGPSQDGQGDPSGASASIRTSVAEPSSADTAAVGPASKGPSTKPKHRKGGLSFVRELPFLLLVAFILALLIKTFLVQAFYIPSESMVPTLNVGDRVLVNKIVYHLHPPRRGDIIVFSDPHPAVVAHRNPFSAFFHWLTDGLGVTTSADKDFIKRVIGLPGEEVEMHQCIVYINGRPLHEPYLDGRKFSNCEYGPVRIAPNSLFVMGDNRDDSNDSRYSLGLIPEDKVVGRAFVIIWPPGRIHLLHGF